MRPMLEPQTRGLFNPGMVELPPPLIVAVDDEADDIFFLRRTIGKTGFAHQFQPFSNGEAAIAAFSAMVSGETPAPFPLISSLDSKMTAMTGFALLRWTR